VESTHVGKWMLERIPPLQGFGGRASVSILQQVLARPTCREEKRYELGVLTWRRDIAAEVGTSVAAVAVLSLERGVWPRALVGVADKHAETL
jgi:hypothetical protein